MGATVKKRLTKAQRAKNAAFWASLSDSTRKFLRERQELKREYGYWNYVAHFEDTGLMKCGMTAHPRKRFLRYVAEAKRHGIGPVQMIAEGGNINKAEALYIESAVCRRFELFIKNGREWIDGDDEMFSLAWRLISDTRFRLIVYGPYVKRPDPKMASLHFSSWHPPEYEWSDWIAAHPEQPGFNFAPQS